MIDVERTIASQFANSPSIVRLVQNMNSYFDQRADFENFYNFVWNVNTAQAWGLDVWGRIVGVSRLLSISGEAGSFGFNNADIPPDWLPFNQGPFYGGGSASASSFELNDTAYRTLILTKALANIVATTAASLNQLIRNLFPNRGKCYVLDLGHMEMRYVFEFGITQVEYAILTQSGALPHPAGVSVSVVVIPVFQNFGFAEQAGAQTFDHGTFYLSL